MSKIRDVKITTSLGGKYMGQYYETKMEYSPKGKVFFIRLPDDQKDFKADFEIEKRLIDDAPVRGYTTIKAVVEEPETFITLIDQGKNLLTAGEDK